MDFNRIPKSTYDEMVDLFGKEVAEDYIKKVNYNFSTINYAIRRAYTKRFYRKYKYPLQVITVVIVIMLLFKYLM